MKWYRHYKIGSWEFAVNWKIVGIMLAIWFAMLVFLPW